MLPESERDGTVGWQHSPLAGAIEKCDGEKSKRSLFKGCFLSVLKFGMGW